MKTRKTISAPMFIATIMRHFQDGGNQTSAAKELGCTPAAVCLRIKYLRSIGAMVPKTANEMRRVKNRKSIKASAMKELKRWM